MCNPERRGQVGRPYMEQEWESHLKSNSVVCNLVQIWASMVRENPERTGKGHRLTLLGEQVLGRELEEREP